MLYAIHPADRSRTGGGGVEVQTVAVQETDTEEAEAGPTDNDRLAGTTEVATPEADSLAPAVSRAARILDVLAESNGEPVGPSELARRLGLPKSSIANICGALADARLGRRVSTGFA